MTQAWVVLTRADGREVASPTEAQLATALAEVYDGAAPANDDGAASTVLRFGYDDGLMYEVEVAGGGAVRFGEWSDRDCEIALAAPRRMLALGRDEALQLWKWLALRQVAKIRSQPWLPD
ncbi:hypothetical protein [Rugamonas rubra]|jgi:hypothetical protein|uniref:Immunity protein Imm1 n=1 Tax=Rugamonas rubra TaxID=758825 RepID=A0A1I4NGP4_9BURK|nr:hypothetical protein [Rugamonas rubra]SFM14555.1 hypothetical protein SAMN02982985_02947 [Rugamonas rubra]